MKRGAVLIALALCFAYPLTYAALRLSHVFVHTAYWVSQEGLDGHHTHAIDGAESVQPFFRPFIAAELWCWRR